MMREIVETVRLPASTDAPWQAVGRFDTSADGAGTVELIRTFLRTDLDNLRHLYVGRA
jgi:hypothetical protein